MSRSVTSITSLLSDLQSGERQAIEKLLPLVYRELRKLAQKNMAAQRSGHTLSPTALVHEAYLKIQDNKEMEFKDRAHFFAVAAQCMRWLLMDHAKQKRRVKRGGNVPPISFNERIHWIDDENVDSVALERALETLGRQDPKLCQVVELRYLTGLSIEETAEALGTSPSTVKRDWRLAKAWLIRVLS